MVSFLSFFRVPRACEFLYTHTSCNNDVSLLVYFLLISIAINLVQHPGSMIMMMAGQLWQHDTSTTLTKFYCI